MHLVSIGIGFDLERTRDIYWTSNQDHNYTNGFIQSDSILRMRVLFFYTLQYTDNA